MGSPGGVSWLEIDRGAPTVLGKVFVKINDLNAGRLRKLTILKRIEMADLVHWTGARRGRYPDADCAASSASI
jgi:hypothetical protein